MYYVEYELHTFTYNSNRKWKSECYLHFHLIIIIPIHKERKKSAPFPPNHLTCAMATPDSINVSEDKVNVKHSNIQIIQKVKRKLLKGLTNEMKLSD